MKASDVSDARLRFRMRTLTNCGIVLVIFLPLAFFFSLFPWSWIADAALIGVLFYLFFFVLDKREIGFRCPHCERYIASNTPWVCGFCQRENRNVDHFPFVHRCEHCQAEPKAYECHHCHKLIFLSKDRLEANFASCLAVEKPPPPPEDKSAVRREAKEALSHELEMADLAGKLDDIKRRVELGKRKPPMEEIEDSFNKHHARFMGTREFARRQRAVNAEKFKDDPDMLKFANESIDAWETSRT